MLFQSRREPVEGRKLGPVGSLLRGLFSADERLKVRRARSCFSMIMAAANNGWTDGDKAMMESLIAFKRAGADGELTYFGES